MARYTVQMLNRRKQIINAEYVRVEQGCLVFRNTVRNTYPVIVMIVAPLMWRSLETAP